jgi:hypothetical protein
MDEQDKLYRRERDKPLNQRRVFKCTECAKQGKVRTLKTEAGVIAHYATYHGRIVTPS